MDTLWTIGTDFQKMRNSYSSNDYTSQTYSALLYAYYQINAFVKYGAQYRLQHSFIHLKGIHNTRRNHELIKESKNGGLISALGMHLLYDSTDHPMLPTQGLKSKIGAEYAGLGGDHNFAKYEYLNSYYYSPYKGGLFKLRGNLQFIQTFGSTHPKDLPLTERLYAGGETSIRGYVFNRVGPTFHDKDHTVRGGMSEALLSAEYDQYLFSRLDGFVFFDAGNVYFQQFMLGKLRASYGYGIKVKLRENTVPLTIGMGYPINPRRKEDVKRFFISFGASF
jgi:outer membrane protein insertion porin family